MRRIDTHGIVASVKNHHACRNVAPVRKHPRDTVRILDLSRDRVEHDLKVAGTANGQSNAVALTDPAGVGLHGSRSQSVRQRRACPPATSKTRRRTPLSGESVPASYANIHYRTLLITGVSLRVGSGVRPIRIRFRTHAILANTSTGTPVIATIRLSATRRGVTRPTSAFW